MNQGTAKTDIYRDDTDRRFFNRLLAGLTPRYGVEVHAYAQMGNHYHLFVRSADGRLSEAMHWLGATYAGEFNRRHGRVGAFFRSRFVSKLVDDERYLAWLPIYIHLNPVRDGFVSRPEDWRWSSYAGIAGYRRKDPWLATGVVGVGHSIVDYRELTERHLRTPMERPSPAALPATPDGVCERWQADEDRRLAVAIEGAVASAFGVDHVDLRNSARRSNPARTTAIGLLVQLTGLDRARIAERYGLRSAQAVSAAARRASTLLASDDRATAAAAAMGITR